MRFAVTLILLGLTVFSSVSVQAAPVLYLSGDGTTADSSGNGNNGVWTGLPSYGAIGSTQGFQLGANGDWVYAPHAASLDMSSPSYVRLSVYFQTSGNTSSERIVDRITAGSGDGYLLDILGGGLRFIAAGSVIYGTIGVPTNTAMRVDAVFDATGALPTLSLYIDGLLNNTATLASGAAWIENHSLDLRIGADSTGGNQFLGTIAQVTLSNEPALPAPEPASVGLLAVGLSAIAWRRRRA